MGGCLPLYPRGLPLDLDGGVSASGSSDVSVSRSVGVYTPWTHTHTLDPQTPGHTASPWIHSLLDTHPPGHTASMDTLRKTPPVEMAIEAGGMNPTEMHSCYSELVLHPKFQNLRAK